MSKFLNTSATNYYLEELIKQTQERLIVISPFLKFNDRIKELLADKDRLKIDVRVVFGKSELAPQEIEWLKSLEFVRTSFCQNLHAKCYVNEYAAIITSMNLYDFSQQNNNEMGVYFQRKEEPQLYQDTYDEAQRLIRVSEQVRLSAEKVEEIEQESPESSSAEYSKLTTANIARHLGIKTGELNVRLVEKGFLERDGEQFKLTEAGKNAGGEARPSKRSKGGLYILWPKNIDIEEEEQAEVSVTRYEKLTTARIANRLGIKTGELNVRLVEKGFLERDGEQFKLTEAGKNAGGEARTSKRSEGGSYILWPKNMTI